jgi:hypothetical protein
MEVAFVWAVGTTSMLPDGFEERAATAAGIKGRTQGERESKLRVCCRWCRAGSV